MKKEALVEFLNSMNQKVLSETDNSIIVKNLDERILDGIRFNYPEIKWIKSIHGMYIYFFL